MPLFIWFLALLAGQDAGAARAAETRRLVEELMAGRTASIVRRFDERMAAALPDERLRQTLSQLQVQAGTFTAVTGVNSEIRGAIVAVTVTCAFTNGPL